MFRENVLFSVFANLCITECHISLQSKAKEMVMLAEKMRQKLLSGPSSHANSNDEDIGSKQDIQDWLLSVGIVSPVTKESAGALYHQQLSRQVFVCSRETFFTSIGGV